jgi:DNA-binding transcriptional ArsR family regulator
MFAAMSRSAADASVFNAIADPTRRGILRLLLDGEWAVSDLLKSLRTSQSALSQHLAVLRRARLVRCRKDGRLRLYRVEPAPLREVVDWVAHFDRFWTDRLDRLGRFLDASAGRRRNAADNGGAERTGRAERPRRGDRR